MIRAEDPSDGSEPCKAAFLPGDGDADLLDDIMILNTCTGLKRRYVHSDETPCPVTNASQCGVTFLDMSRDGTTIVFGTRALEDNPDKRFESVWSLCVTDACLTAVGPWAAVQLDSAGAQGFPSRTLENNDEFAMFMPWVIGGNTGQYDSELWSMPGGRWVDDQANRVAYMRHGEVRLSTGGDGGVDLTSGADGVSGVAISGDGLTIAFAGTDPGIPSCPTPSPTTTGIYNLQDIGGAWTCALIAETEPLFGKPLAPARDLTISASGLRTFWVEHVDGELAVTNVHYATSVALKFCLTCEDDSLSYRFPQVAANGAAIAALQTDTFTTPRPPTKVVLFNINDLSGPTFPVLGDPDTPFDVSPVTCNAVACWGDLRTIVPANLLILSGEEIGGVRRLGGGWIVQSFPDPESERPLTFGPAPIGGRSVIQIVGEGEQLNIRSWSGTHE